ncbi:hypothetical protein E4U43_001216 [Claviceps pusilla]|uniref:Uncharacterized protein n=1 Tax=Claviceps pusilla TaxID=123648 RepID=A0A9P7SW47_9HYPO|nr:hypothetical protein E4U43_001216 [Claviceps pusilla]
MSNPRIKRQFAGASADPAQRQITSFFSSSSSSSPRSGGHDEAPSSPFGAQTQALRPPLLPSSVQANLLSVGMRIRKSVPEGYKTCGPSAFTLWTDNSTATTSASPAAAAATTIPPQSAPRAPPTELVPFCGINKVGGLGIQPPSTFAQIPDPDSDSDSDDPSHMSYPDLVPELTLSQASVESTASGPEPSRKRVYSDNELHEPPTMLAQPLRGWDEEVSPRSFAPSEWQSSRIMAVPKPRVRKSLWSGGSEQEHGAGNGDEDFEEAEFLVFGEGTHEMDIS